MVSWILSHYGDLVVLAILGLMAGFAIGSLVRGKKKGHACGSCPGCAMAGCCQRHKI